MYLIRRLSRHPLLVDGLFAFAVGVLAVLGSIAAGADQTDMTRLDTGGFALLVVGAAGLVLRRRMPGVAVAITFIVTMLYIYLRYPYGPIFIYATIAIYSAAAWRSTRFAVTAVALAVLAHVPWSLWGEREPDSFAFTTMTTAVWLASPLAVGVAVRTQRRAHAKSLLEERDRHAYEERLRIAQEVHDAVGHSLAVISMNAGAALHVLTKQPGPPQVSESLLSDDPGGAKAEQTVERLRQTVHDIDPAGLVGGSTAQALDQDSTMDSDLRLVIPLILLVVLGVLMVLLRALVAPLLLLAGVVLSFGAALGASAAVFHLLGFPTLDKSVLLNGFLFLVALGVDYTIFLMTRAREETALIGHRAGVPKALAVTGGVITSAGIVLAATFSVLAVMPVVFMLQLGVVVAVGVLLDTFVVRSLLVPRALARCRSPGVVANLPVPLGGIVSGCKDQS